MYSQTKLYVSLSCHIKLVGHDKNNKISDKRHQYNLIAIILRKIENIVRKDGTRKFIWKHTRTEGLMKCK